MPVVRDPEIETGDDEIGSFTATRFSDTGGLTQFGAFTETLSPGSRSSNLHWHASSDEFVYVLSGTVTLREGDTLTEMEPGMAATFKAGVPVGHYLENRTDEPVTYLVVGTRSDADVVTYPLSGEVLTLKDGVKTLQDAAGNILRTEKSQR